MLISPLRNQKLSVKMLVLLQGAPTGNRNCEIQQYLLLSKPFQQVSTVFSSAPPRLKSDAQSYFITIFKEAGKRGYRQSRAVWCDQDSEIRFCKDQVCQRGLEFICSDLSPTLATELQTSSGFADKLLIRKSVFQQECIISTRFWLVKMCKENAIGQNLCI